MDLKSLVQKLNKDLNLSAQLKPFGRTKELMIEVDSAEYLRVSQWLRSEESARLDWVDNLSVAELKNALVFTVFLRSQALTHTLILKTETAFRGQDPVDMPSIGKIWPMALAHESEIATLFGVNFVGSNLEKARAPFPLRKDYSWEFGLE